MLLVFLITKYFMFLVCIRFFLNFPDSQIFCSRRKYILLASFNIRDPHNFGWWKFVFEFINFPKTFIWLFEVEINDKVDKINEDWKVEKIRNQLAIENAIKEGSY